MESICILFYPLIGCLLKLADNYQVDLTKLDFRKLIGFDSKKITKTEYGTNLPDITRGVDEVHIKL